MTEASALQTVLTGATLLVSGALALIQHLSKKADSARDDRLKDIHDTVLSLRGEVSKIDSDVRRHSEQLGGLSVASAATTDRLGRLETVIQSVVTRGCAHRRYCRTPSPPDDDTSKP
jgi:hypothetical protein